MKYYELTYLLPPDLSEEEARATSERINAFIPEESGILGKMEKPAKKRLGQKIKDKEKAFMGSVEFSLNPEKIKGLEKRLKSENSILRHFLVSKPPVKKKPSRKPKKEKVDIKEIDKKIDQLLDQ